MALKILGHRGARGEVAENSILGLNQAINAGSAGVEFDVQLCRDGSALVYHDLQLNRAFTRLNGEYITQPVPIEDLSLEDVLQFDIGTINPRSVYAKRFPNQVANDAITIPTLAQWLTTQAPPNFLWLLEVKSDPTINNPRFDIPALARILCRELDDYPHHNIIVESFDWRLIEAIKRIAPHLKTALLSDRSTLADQRWTGSYNPHNYATPLDLILDTGTHYWAPHYSQLNAKTVQRAHENNIELMPWTVNRPRQIETLRSYGINTIITDYPSAYVKIAGN